MLVLTGSEITPEVHTRLSLEISDQRKPFNIQSN